jgi:hypothetical protein
LAMALVMVLAVALAVELALAVALAVACTGIGGGISGGMSGDVRVRCMRYGKLGTPSNGRHMLPICIALDVHAYILSMKLLPSIGGEDCLHKGACAVCSVQCAVCSVQCAVYDRAGYRYGLQASVHDALESWVP